MLPQLLPVSNNVSISPATPVTSGRTGLSVLFYYQPCRGPVNAPWVMLLFTKTTVRNQRVAWGLNNVEVLAPIRKKGFRRWIKRIFTSIYGKKAQ
jgi:hypothetical protein